MSDLNHNHALDEQRMLYVYQGLNVAMKLLNQHLDAQPAPSQSTDVLGEATRAYQQGKITKAQYLAVINALDENTTVQTTARVERPKKQQSRDYMANANKILNQFGG